MGPFGFGNLGDAFSLQAMIQHVEKYFPEAEIFGFTLNPEDTEKRHGIKCYPVSRMSWKENEGKEKGLWAKLTRWLETRPNPILQKLKRWIERVPLELGMILEASKRVKEMDLFIVTGSGQLQDYWGGGGPWSYPYTLLKWGALAKLHRTPLMVVSVGAGPIDAKLSQLFIRWSLSFAGYRSYRDEYSKKYVRDIVGLVQDDPVYPDLAFSYQLTTPLPVQVETTRKFVGIGPIGYFKHWPEQDEAIYADYLAKIVAFIGWLLDKNYAIVFLRGEAYYDGLVIDDLKGKLRKIGLDPEKEPFIAADILTVDQLLFYLSVSDFVVASRYHNVLIAYMLNKPVFALSYQAKIESLMASVEQSQYCLPLGDFDNQSLQAGFEDLVLNQVTNCEKIAKNVPSYNISLHEQYERIFGNL